MIHHSPPSAGCFFYLVLRINLKDGILRRLIFRYISYAVGGFVKTEMLNSLIFFEK